MSVCVWVVCIYVCMCVCGYVFTCVCICVYMCLYICVCVREGLSPAFQAHTILPVSALALRSLIKYTQGPEGRRGKGTARRLFLFLLALDSELLSLRSVLQGTAGWAKKIPGHARFSLALDRPSTPPWPYRAPTLQAPLIEEQMKALHLWPLASSFSSGFPVFYPSSPRPHAGLPGHKEPFSETRVVMGGGLSLR